MKKARYRLLIIFSILVSSTVSCAGAGAETDVLASNFLIASKNADDFVIFYSGVRTGSRTQRREEIRARATAKFERWCGPNCAISLAPLRSKMAGATKIVCPDFPFLTELVLRNDSNEIYSLYVSVNRDLIYVDDACWLLKEEIYYILRSPEIMFDHRPRL